MSAAPWIMAAGEVAVWAHFWRVMLDRWGSDFGFLVTKPHASFADLLSVFNDTSKNLSANIMLRRGNMWGVGVGLPDFGKELTVGEWLDAFGVSNSDKNDIAHALRVAYPSFGLDDIDIAFLIAQVESIDRLEQKLGKLTADVISMRVEELIESMVYGEADSIIGLMLFRGPVMSFVREVMTEVHKGGRMRPTDWHRHADAAYSMVISNVHGGGPRHAGKKFTRLLHDQGVPYVEKKKHAAIGGPVSTSTKWTTGAILMALEVLESALEDALYRLTPRGWPEEEFRVTTGGGTYEFRESVLFFPWWTPIKHGTGWSRRSALERDDARASLLGMELLHGSIHFTGLSGGTSGARVYSVPE